MQILPTDIIIRNYKDGETLWVSQRLVVQLCGVSEEYIWKVRSVFKSSIKKGYKYAEFLPHTGTAWRWGKANNTFYYDFDCIPDRLPTQYRSKLGTKQQLISAYESLKASEKRNFREQIKTKIQQSASQLIDNTDVLYYMYHSTVGFTQAQAQEMATARAYCRYILQQLRGDAFKKLGINKKQDFYQMCTEILSPLGLEGFKISSAAYLRNKLDGFPAFGDVMDQLNYFVSGRYGNDNAQVVGRYPLVDETTGQVYDFDIHKAIMFQLYMNPGGSTKEYIRTLWERYYCEDVQAFDLQPIAYRTFCHHLTRFNRLIQTARARHGEDYYKKHVQTYVTAEKLQYAHSLFCGDGSGTIQYKYKKPNGKWDTMKLFVILITDVASRNIVGWSAAPAGSHKESGEMVEDAVKMAIETSGRQTMFEFISDNHSAFTSAESKAFLNLVFKKVRNIEVGNSQANPAETQFRLFKRSLKDITNFLSTSWEAGIEGQANADHVDIEDLPTYEDACIQMHELIKRWNHTKLRDGVTPAERFQIKHPDCKPMEVLALRYLFGKHTEVDLSYMRGYVNVYRSNGYNDSKLFQFEIPDYGGAGTEMIARAIGYTTGARLKVVWDEEMADLYTLEGKFIMSCPRALKASQSRAETTDGTMDALGHHLSRKTKQSAFIDEFEANLTDVVNGLGYTHAMAMGGTKESWNQSNGDHENSKIKESAKRRVNRDFNDADWTDPEQ